MFRRRQIVFMIDQRTNYEGNVYKKSCRNIFNISFKAFKLIFYLKSMKISYPAKKN